MYSIRILVIIILYNTVGVFVTTVYNQMNDLSFSYAVERASVVKLHAEDRHDKR